MALNYPGPYEVRLNYTVNGEVHQHRHSLDLDTAPVPGDLFSFLTGTTRDLTVTTLSAWVDAVWTVMADRFKGADCTFGTTELWKYTPLTFQSSFISSYQTTVVPVGIATTATLYQETYSMRTIEGNIFKVVFMEAINPTEAQLLYPTASASINAVFDLFCNASASIALARDTSFPFSPLRYSPGQNEALWRKAHR